MFGETARDLYNLRESGPEPADCREGSIAPRADVLGKQEPHVMWFADAQRGRELVEVMEFQWSYFKS